MFLGSESVVIIRQEPATVVDFETVQGVRSVVRTKATVNPMPEDAETLPRGQDLDHHRLVLTKTQLRPPDEDDGYAGDLLVYYGEVFEVYSVKNFRQLIPHYEAKVRRVSKARADEVLAIPGVL